MKRKNSTREQAGQNLGEQVKGSTSPPEEEEEESEASW